MQFLESIAGMKNGFSFGDLWQYKKESPVAVLPILRVTEDERAYILLNEAEKVKIRDTGMIHKIEIENFEAKPIYVRVAELFAGKTQERMAVRSYVVSPGPVVSIDVGCVHASRGISPEAEMKTGGIAPSSLDRSIFRNMSNDTEITQSEIWNTVSTETMGLSGTSSSFTSFGFRTDDLKANLDAFNELLTEILEEIPHVDDQVGIALHDKDKVIGVEVFDQSDSWQAIKNAILSKEGANISKVEEDQTFKFNENHVVKHVQDVLLASYEEKIIFESPDYKVIGLISDDYVGEVTELDGKVIHLSLLSTDKNDAV